VIKSKCIIWAGHTPFIGELRNAYKTFIRKPEGKRPCAGPRHGWEIILKWT
jgi:hypothetical protein